MEEDFQSLTWT